MCPTGCVCCLACYLYTRYKLQDGIDVKAIRVHEYTAAKNKRADGNYYL